MTPERLDIDQLPGYALRRAANAMIGRLAERLSGLDIRVSEATAMILVNNGDCLTASDIARALDIRRTNMVPMLKRLEDRGLIERRALDGKSQALMLTAQGEKVLAAARQEIAAFEAELIARVPEPHREHLLPALQALYLPP